MPTHAEIDGRYKKILVRPRAALYIFPTRYVFFFLAAFFGALFVATFCLQFSKDAFAYRELFDSLSDQLGNLAETPTPEIFFWGYLNIFRAFGISFEFAIFLLTFFVILIKLNALEKLTVSFGYTAFAYFSILFLLHEGTQIRISSALAFALWACLFITQHRWSAALICVGIGIGFHITSLILPLVFFFCYQFRMVINGAWVVWLASAALFLLGFSILGGLSGILLIFGGRYLDYGSDSMLENQNTSGLVFIYAFIIAIMLLVLWRSEKGKLSAGAHLNKACIATAIYGNSLILLLHETIAIAVRLSDVLLIMVLPVIGTFMLRTNQANRLMIIIALMGFFLMRYQNLFAWN